MSKLVVCKVYGKDRRNFFVKHKIIIGIGAIVIAVLIMNWGSQSAVTQSVDPNTGTTAVSTPVVAKPVTAPVVAKLVTASKAKNWQKVIAFSGNSIEKTQKFTINSDEWRIKWSTLPSEYGDTNFIVSVYDENGGLVNIVINSIGKGADESYMTGTGTYYLEIATVQKYNIIIEENE